MSDIRNLRPFVLVAILITFASTFLSGQTNPAPNPASQTATDITPLAFDAVSIKPNKSSSPQGTVGNRSDGLYLVNMSLMVLLSQGFPHEQILGVPEWLRSNRYDLEAKVAGSDLTAYHQASPAQRNRMLLAVFEDRLKLKEHTETRELPIFALTVAKNGSKLKAASQDDIKGTNPPGDSLNQGDGLYWVIGKSPDERQLIGQGVSMQRLGQHLSYSNGIDRLVVDKTGLEGQYSFSLEWANPNAVDSSAPSITTAIQEQLGLKLEPTKGPVEVLVIDHVERPTEN